VTIDLTVASLDELHHRRSEKWNFATSPEHLDQAR
jgi:hypothetical protein